MWTALLMLMLALPAAGPTAWPIDPPRVVAGFDRPTAPWDAGHRGIDLAGHTGDAVRAAAAGSVLYAGLVAGKPVVSISLDRPAGRRVTYEPVLAEVAAGMRVAAGQRIGTLATAGGHCGGQAGCLHLGLRDAEGYLDPMVLLLRPPAVLKPSR